MRKLVTALILGCTLVFLMPACSTVNKTAYKTTQVTSATADIALHVWADYVAHQKALGTPVPLAQEVQAKRAWNAFQDARDGVVKAGIAYSQAKTSGEALPTFEAQVSAAVSAMAAASSDFINLLQSFGVTIK